MKAITFCINPTDKHKSLHAMTKEGKELQKVRDKLEDRQFSQELEDIESESKKIGWDSE